MKSGTSDLAVTIMSHPNVMHPLVKEFSSLDPHAWRPFYPTLKSVQRHAKRHGGAACAFVGPYLHCLSIPTVLTALRPDAKIVINLRDPAALVFSIWKWTVVHTEKQLVDRVPYLSTFPAFVEKAIELFPETPAPFGAALHHGIYATSVAHWLRSFGQNNVRFFDIAEYFNDRNSYFFRLEEFLGLPHVSLPQVILVANPSPLVGLKMNPETTVKLRNFFGPYNDRLWQVIETSYPW